jgi:hypothetical protein
MAYGVFGLRCPLISVAQSNLDTHLGEARSTVNRLMAASSERGSSPWVAPPGLQNMNAGQRVPYPPARRTSHAHTKVFTAHIMCRFRLLKKRHSRSEERRGGKIRRSWSATVEEPHISKISHSHSPGDRTRLIFAILFVIAPPKCRLVPLTTASRPVEPYFCERSGQDNEFVAV